MAAGPLGAAAAGLALGIAFNPLTSLVGAPIAAGILGFPRARHPRAAWALTVAVVAWLLGDGFRVMARLRDALDTTPAAVPYALLATWALAGLAAGYLLPAGVGAYVGRRVVRGTGWLSAVFVAGISSVALAAVAAPAASLLVKLAGS